MTTKSKIAITVTVALLLVAAGVSWYLQLTPKSGTVCSTPGQVVKAVDGSLLTCQDGVQWKPAN